MEFRCRIASAAGEVTEQSYIAESETRLRRNLEDKGFFVLSLRPKGGLRGLSLGQARRGRVGRQEFVVFNQELATLLKAGMPLVQSLDILRQRVTNVTFKAVIDGVHERVKAGMALSDAFNEHGDLFPAVYGASVLAGERSGNLEGVLRRYVAYEKILGHVRRRTISALIYPAVLVVMMLVLMGIIVLQVVPGFSTFYANFDKQLPLSTRVIVAVSDVAVGNFWLIVVGLGAGIFAAWTWAKPQAQRAKLHRMLLELPWVGDTARKFATAQLARTLATLLGGGIPLVNAIEIGARAMTNRHLAAELEDVRTKVVEGQGFAASLAAQGTFPDVAIKMIEVGESTGALQEMLNSLAEFYDEEIETEVGRFITLVEPALLICMGIVIAGVVLALYMPVFEMSSIVGR